MRIGGGLVINIIIYLRRDANVIISLCAYRCVLIPENLPLRGSLSSLGPHVSLHLHLLLPRFQGDEPREQTLIAIPRCRHRSIVIGCYQPSQVDDVPRIDRSVSPQLIPLFLPILLERHAHGSIVGEAGDESCDGKRPQANRCGLF